MRVLLAALVLLALAAQAHAASWGIFADNACSISLYSNTFTLGSCTAQSSGSSTVYFITTCDNTGKWSEQTYTDSACTKKAANGFNTGTSGTCFASGQYFGQVICGSSSASNSVNAASSAAVPALIVPAVLALVALVAMLA